jgi:hypothetical protein
MTMQYSKTFSTSGMPIVSRDSISFPSYVHAASRCIVYSSSARRLSDVWTPCESLLRKARHTLSHQRGGLGSVGCYRTDRWVAGMEMYHESLVPPAPQSIVASRQKTPRSIPLSHSIVPKATSSQSTKVMQSGGPVAAEMWVVLKLVPKISTPSGSGEVTDRALWYLIQHFPGVAATPRISTHD